MATTLRPLTAHATLREVIIMVNQLLTLQQGGIFTKAGIPADTDFAAPVDGLLALDSTDSRLYVRKGGAWHYAGLT